MSTTSCTQHVHACVCVWVRDTGSWQRAKCWFDLSEEDTFSTCAGKTSLVVVRLNALCCTERLDVKCAFIVIGGTLSACQPCVSRSYSVCNKYVFFLDCRVPVVWLYQHFFFMSQCVVKSQSLFHSFILYLHSFLRDLSRIRKSL